MNTTATTKRISAIVPLYLNHATKYPIVADFFDSMKLYPDIEMVVIDDASPFPLFPNWGISHINEKNKGFTATVNKGLEIATGDILLVLNDDLKIKKGDLDRFYTIGEGIYSPRDTASDDTDRFGAIWGMTRDTYNKLGKLDEKYKHYFSDLDYYNRAKAKGIPIVKWHDIVVEHKESSTYRNEDKEKLFNDDMERMKSN